MILRRFRSRFLLLLHHPDTLLRRVPPTPFLRKSPLARSGMMRRTEFSAGTAWAACTFHVSDLGMFSHHHRASLSCVYHTTLKPFRSGAVHRRHPFCSRIR
ncbi:uncharacterized protein K489DRAFT_219065 [Dissoconium aciculare CBS 342.82]|uniref:Uncharacterized protein n=1 Tax=Dissoconium aciculare CBS 342.82 TaxID=1314786 RepID=A0A6J3M4Q1_9PEZI|nr:uncharacterized protein K489DRAFT_219065 [Dissoconium aciculare CBS 342.82]KAF1822873.1 hypothetical protein K489DRAFT_219065 [Dissoconium aciculare CBS 342.82]